jgi:beta-glucosidase
LGVRQPSGTIEQAVAAARASDAVVVMVGSASTTEAEGYDRADLDLPGPQNALVEAVLAANPNTAVVINAGSPVTLPWIDQAKSALVAWLPGEEGCAALAEVLFGHAAPSGRLPVSFPQRLEDTAAYPYYSDALQAPYAEGLFIGYRHHDRSGIEPLFPFGHGLTYTDFGYEEITATSHAAAGDPVAVSVTLTNAGPREGQEVVQLYVAPRAPPVSRPVKELKGFSKLAMASGETRTIPFNLTGRDFAFYDPDAKAWVTEPGDYDLLVGASAGDIRLRATVRLS